MGLDDDGAVVPPASGAHLPSVMNVGIAEVSGDASPCAVFPQA
jgi:hypothetical protein